jgi:hypothetical protein
VSTTVSPKTSPAPWNLCPPPPSTGSNGSGGNRKPVGTPAVPPSKPAGQPVR